MKRQHPTLKLLTLSLLGSALTCNAEVINIGVSFAIPPYVIQENDTGLEIELLRAALARMGHSTEIQYRPLARTFKELKDGKLDGIINTQPHMLDGVFYTDEVISFQNCAFSLSSRQLSIGSLQDLKGKSVVAFQKASTLLGEEFGREIASQQDYTEIATQRNQIHLLFRGRADVIILERSIFGYYRRQEVDAGFTDALSEVDENCVFPPTHYRFAFRSEQIRDDFNQGFRAIADDGTLESIRAKYRDMLALPDGR